MRDRTTRNILVVMAFDLAGCGVVFWHFGMSWYTLAGCAFVIIACTIAGNILNRREGEQ